jgi:putative DNA primase/helicase
VISFRSSQDLVRELGAASSPSGARTLLAKISTDKLTDAAGVLLETFTARQIVQKSWTGPGTTDAVRKAADLLADWEYLRVEAVPSTAVGGRLSERYRSPRLSKRAAA